VSYGFYAVAGFVGLPFSLWIALTRPWEGPRVVVPTPVPVAVPAKKAATRRKR